MKIKFWLGLFALLIVAACSDDNTGTDNPNNPGEPSDPSGFERKAILTNWADNIIIPSYEGYVSAVTELQASTETFNADLSEENLINLRADMLEAYIAWQHVSMFEIGEAERIQLRNFTNIYPANVAEIEAKTAGAEFNLELPSTFDEQGFPALDYLLFGTGSTETEVIAYFNANAQASVYLQAVADRLNILGTQVLEAWKNGGREDFVNNDSDSSTGSFNKMVNAFIQYYERNLRAGKIGIPAGALSGQPFADRVEAFYAKNQSKNLFIESLQATADFYNGKAFGSASIGASLNSALSDLDNKALADDINDQFDLILQSAQELNENLALQVETDNSAMLEIRDELQVNTILFKNDMVSALNVTISYQDNDGD